MNQMQQNLKATFFFTREGLHWFKLPKGIAKQNGTAQYHDVWNKREGGS